MLQKEKAVLIFAGFVTKKPYNNTSEFVINQIQLASLLIASLGLK